MQVIRQLYEKSIVRTYSQPLTNRIQISILLILLTFLTTAAIFLLRPFLDYLVTHYNIH